ncbi:Trihelix transcription factor ASIL2 [Bienertia sinuspersici]
MLLKGQDWEDVAKHVSSRANNTKSPKTQTQCKNKIESMKKRYRSESATADTSSWPLFSRLNNLLRGTGGSSGFPPPQSSPMKAIVVTSNPGLVLESSPVTQQQVPPQQVPPPPPVEIAQNSREDKGVATAKIQTKTTTMKIMLEPQMTIALLLCNGSEKGRRESIRWLAEAVVHSEQVRIDTMRELERMRVEAEAKRGEMDLKRTEIIANTQLEITRLFALTATKNVDSSLRIGRT